MNKNTFDKFCAALAGKLSFGTPTAEMQRSAVLLESPDICIIDAGTMEPEGWIHAYWPSVIEPFLRLRYEPWNGIKVVAADVYWWNILHSKSNPLGMVGYFTARIYTDAEPAPTQDPDRPLHP